MIKLL